MIIINEEGLTYEEIFEKLLERLEELEIEHEQLTEIIDRLQEIFDCEDDGVIELEFDKNDLH